MASAPGGGSGLGRGPEARARGALGSRGSAWMRSRAWPRSGGRAAAAEPPISEQCVLCLPQESRGLGAGPRARGRGGQQAAFGISSGKDQGWGC